MWKKECSPTTHTSRLFCLADVLLEHGDAIELTFGVVVVLS
jgi:hypothetical protein